MCLLVLCALVICIYYDLLGLVVGWLVDLYVLVLNLLVFVLGFAVVCLCVGLVFICCVWCLLVCLRCCICGIVCLLLSCFWIGFVFTIGFLLVSVLVVCFGFVGCGVGLLFCGLFVCLLVWFFNGMVLFLL